MWDVEGHEKSHATIVKSVCTEHKIPALCLDLELHA